MATRQTHGMPKLAKAFAEAIAKDETPESGGCDMHAGMYGPNVSQLLRDIQFYIDEYVPPVYVKQLVGE